MANFSFGWLGTMFQHFRNMANFSFDYFSPRPSAPPPHPPPPTHPPPPPPPPHDDVPPALPPPLEEAVRKGSHCYSMYLHRRSNKNNPARFYWQLSEGPEIKSLDPSEMTKNALEACAIRWHLIETKDENKALLEFESFFVNSSLLQISLAKVLEGYPGLTKHNLDSFARPFLPFVHHWQELNDLEATQDLENEAKKHLQLLLRSLTPALRNSFDTLRTIGNTNHVAFEDLCLIFVPATIVYRHNPPSAGVLRDCSLDEKGALRAWKICVEVVDFDGSRCGLSAQEWFVSKFEGQRSLDALSITPLNKLSDKQNISLKLIERGRKFEHYRQNTVATYTDSSCNRIKERVIVNATQYHANDAFQKSPPIFSSLTEIGRLTWDQSMARDMGRPEKAVSRSKEPDLTPLTDDQRLLTISTIKCFNTSNMTWECLEVSKLEDVQWASSAFNDLVLSGPHKDSLLAMVDPNLHRNSELSKDLIEGKGQGTTILLSGPPGVGKTLTAEALAERFHRPLYRLGAALLGTDSRTISVGLKKHMKQATSLGAFLLIDEADMFLEDRSKQDVSRIAIVGEFIQAIEYYNGTLFLTTNRRGKLDEAAISRMSLILSYKDLTQNDRGDIWRKSLKQSSVKDLDILELSRPELNGRRIKQTITLASALAVSKMESLTQEHLKIALAAQDYKLA